jgi:predicted transcriptional regulator
MPAKKPPDAPFAPNLYVVARFLDALAQPDATWTRSALQAAVGVNYDVFRRYADFLVAKGYAVARGEGRGAETLALTAQGRAVRGELRGFIARFLGESRLEGAAPSAPQTLKGGAQPAPPE